MFSAALYARVQLSLHYSHTRPRVQRASGIPCALWIEGEKFPANLGRNASRECEGVSTVIARSVCDEAIHLSARGKYGLLRFALMHKRFAFVADNEEYGFTFSRNVAPNSQPVLSFRLL